MERWLSQQLAEHFNVWSNFRYLFPSKFFSTLGRQAAARPVAEGLQQQVHGARARDQHVRDGASRGDLLLRRLPGRLPCAAVGLLPPRPVRDGDAPVDAHPAGPLCGHHGCTLTWTLLANTWVLPLQGLAIALWIAVNWRDWRRLVPAVAAGAAIIWLAAWVYLSAFTSAASGYDTAVRLVPWIEHTPPLLLVRSSFRRLPSSCSASPRAAPRAGGSRRCGSRSSSSPSSSTWTTSTPATTTASTRPSSGGPG